MSETTDRYAVFETAAGFCAIAWNAKAITRFQLATARREAAERLMSRRAPHAVPTEPTGEVAMAIADAKRYFAGDKVSFSQIALDLDDQDPAFREIYEVVRAIGWGNTTTYGTLARDLGKEPQFARDVGQAMAKNPVPLIIPCHRVLAAGGKVGGFSAPGGAASKVKMLELEGIALGAKDPAQSSFGF